MFRILETPDGTGSAFVCGGGSSCFRKRFATLVQHHLVKTCGVRSQFPRLGPWKSETQHLLNTSTTSTHPLFVVRELTTTMHLLHTTTTTLTTTHCDAPTHPMVPAALKLECVQRHAFTQRNQQRAASQQSQQRRA